MQIRHSANTLFSCVTYGGIVDALYGEKDAWVILKIIGTVERFAAGMECGDDVAGSRVSEHTATERRHGRRMAGRLDKVHSDLP